MRLQAIDIFCGAGGLSLGLQWAGIEVIAGIDSDPDCRYPFTTNIGAIFRNEDVNALSAEGLRARFAPDAIKVLAGCAPCQPFSGYAAAHGKVGDERVDLLMRFLLLVETIAPEIVTLENVARLVHLSIWRSFTDGLQNMGYHVAWEVIDAAAYGVPQHRRRLVLVASRMAPIAVPVGTAGPAVTVKDVLSELAPVVAGKSHPRDPLHAARALTDVNLARIKASTPAGTWRDWPEELRADCHRRVGGKTFPSVYGRMSWESPSPTITTQFYGFGNGRFGHPEQDRAITLREGAILQSFPPSFRFAPPGKKVNFRSVGRLIGNAVPPKLAQAIGTTIVDHVMKACAQSQVTH